MKKTKPKVCQLFSCKNIVKERKFCSDECKTFARLKTVSQLKKATWKLFSQYIKRRDADERGYGKCITCGRIELASHHDMHAGHWIHGDNPGTWTNDKNVHLQCGFKCNVSNGGQKDIYALWLEERYGFGILQELNKAYHHLPQTWSMPALREEYRRVKAL